MIMCPFDEMNCFLQVKDNEIYSIADHGTFDACYTLKSNG